MVQTKKELKEYKAKWYKKNIERYRIKGKEHYKQNKEILKEKNKNWRKNHPERVKEMRTKNQKDYIKKYPKKVKAHNLAHYNIKITKDCLCEICKKRYAKHMHHPDYDKPLEVVFVCIKCHNNLHNGGGK